MLSTCIAELTQGMLYLVASAPCGPPMLISTQLLSGNPCIPRGSKRVVDPSTPGEPKRLASPVILMMLFCSADESSRCASSAAVRRSRRSSMLSTRRITWSSMSRK